MVFRNLPQPSRHRRGRCRRRQWDQSNKHVHHRKSGPTHIRSRHGHSHGLPTCHNVSPLRFHPHCSRSSSVIPDPLQCLQRLLHHLRTLLRRHLRHHLWLPHSHLPRLHRDPRIRQRPGNPGRCRRTRTYQLSGVYWLFRRRRNYFRNCFGPGQESHVHDNDDALERLAGGGYESGTSKFLFSHLAAVTDSHSRPPPPSPPPLLSP